MKNLTFSTLIALLTALTSCDVKSKKTDLIESDTLAISGNVNLHEQNEAKDTLIISDTAKNTISANYKYIGNVLLHGYAEKIKYYYKKYKNDTCITERYTNDLLSQHVEGVKEIGDLNNDNRQDSIFILPGLNQCEQGQSYYFSDTTIPRLSTDSYCCHLSSLFTVGDIDEDGIDEIGEYYTSCASRYKSLIVHSLKNNRWQIVGRCTFDVYYSEYGSNYSSYIKKTGKGLFEMLEITDLPIDKSKVGKKYWLKFKM